MSSEAERKLTERYEREATAYRDCWAPVLHPPGVRLLDELAGEPVERVLDVAAGVGTLLPDLAQRFPEALVVAADRSRGMLALAPAAGPRVVADAQVSALASARFDLVLFVFVLFHLERPVDALREGRRVLRPGGRVGTLTWGGEFEIGAQSVWDECLDAHGAAEIDPRASIARHESMDTPAKVEALLRAAGLATVRAWTGDLVHTFDVEQFVLLRTNCAIPRQRFESLEAPARIAFLAEACSRLGALDPADFVGRGRVVYAVAGMA